jgi:hypothetical protein
MNQQNYGGQTIHGNQSNVTPNFNTVIQSATQPFVQNNSNTLVQNNTNVIQPINLVNFNHVSLESIQSIFGTQKNLLYLSQTSSSTTTSTSNTMTTSSSTPPPSTTTTTTTTATTNSNVSELLLPSTTHSILPSAVSTQEQQHQISIRPKPSLLHANQELVPVIPKIKSEHFESITRQLSSSSSSSSVSAATAATSSTMNNNDTTNLLDNDSTDGKQKHPRPIRPKPSSRTHGSQVNKHVYR